MSNRSNIRSIAFAAAFFLLGCASGGLTLPAPQPVPASDVIAGFDTREYPGDAAMRTWRAESPYRWVGYYLPAPCYTGRSWIGRRAALDDMGWGMAVLFVGEQDWAAMNMAADSTVAVQGAQCTSSNVTAERGATDAATADSTMSAEGFAPGTPVYLDVERMEQVSPAMEAYVRAWFDSMLARGRYLPALYAHERNATILYGAARAAFDAAGRTDDPILWVARSAEFDVTMRPEHSGILSASIWQGRFNARETWGDTTLLIDANVARVATPGLLAR